MKIIKTTLAALLAATLMGCATSPTTENVKDVTISQPACCASFSEFEWIPMQGDDIDFAIDQYSQIGDFAEGKSYFAGFVLPENVDRMRVDLNSWLRVAGVFAPKVLLLDENFQVVESIELNDFELKLSDMFRLSSYHNRFVMERKTTPYMVVYSPKEYREGEIQVPHPERLRAEELGLARPMVTDPVYQHQKFGSLELTLKPLALRSYRAAQVPTPVTEAPVKPQPQPVKVEKAVAASAPAMLPESEAFYNSQIKAAVEKNEMQKALSLMEEAKRAGSTSAEATFLELIKK